MIGAAAAVWYFLLDDWLTGLSQTDSDNAPLASSLVSNLEIPWALDFLPDGSIVLTERPGRIRYIDFNGELQAEPLLTVSDVAASGEGGLLGIAVHPGFSQNGYIYVYLTYHDDGGLANRVVRYTCRGFP
ncbi:MAG: PQQ-dependent sugar dehydrogenase [Dehalococcoidales bacterium]